MKNTDLKPLLDAIESHDMASKWRGSLFSTAENEQDVFEEKKEKAISNYKKMMESSKNNGTEDYRSWAIGTALNTKRYLGGRFKTKSRQ